MDGWIARMESWMERRARTVAGMKGCRDGGIVVGYRNRGMGAWMDGWMDGWIWMDEMGG